MAIGFYNNTFDKNYSVVAANEVCAWITNGKWKDTVEYLRKLNKAEYDAEKKKLAAVTWSGVFEEGTRSIETLKKYSSFICLDVDNLTMESINTIKGQLNSDPYVIFCFTSPSGKGIKIIVCVNTKAENHRAAFLHLQHYFETTYFIKIDKSGKDVSRLCYMSYDPEAVWGDTAKIQVFQVELKYGEIVMTNQQTAEEYKSSKDNQHIFKVCVSWIEKKFTFVEGERNNFVHALACALNRCGVPMEAAESMISSNYAGLEVGEFNATMKSAYFHNQGEHGSVQVRDMGTHEFTAPPYIANYNQDVVLNDLMTITAALWHKGVDKAILTGIVVKVAKYYQSQGYIDINRDDLKGLMNKAVAALNQNIAANASQNSLAYESAEGMINDLLKMDFTNGVKTYIEPLDKMIGCTQPGNFYGIVGFPETFKSILAQFIAFMNAAAGVPVLYLNAEMAKIQYYERLVLQALGKNLRSELAFGNIKDPKEFQSQIEATTKNNMFVFSGTSFNKKSILATIDHIFATTGKKVQLVFMDGLSHMDQLGLQEAPANIQNSLICKEISKEAHGGEGVVLMALIHCSGQENRLLRNTGTVVRGGSKLLGNMDGYFSTSLFVDPESINLENSTDISFREGKFCLRFNDKRGGSGVHYIVLNLTNRLMLEAEQTDYREYELKIS